MIGRVQSLTMAARKFRTVLLARAEYWSSPSPYAKSDSPDRNRGVCDPHGQTATLLSCDVTYGLGHRAGLRLQSQRLKFWNNKLDFP